MSTRKKNFEPIKNNFPFKISEKELGEFETVHKEELDFVRKKNQEVAEKVLTYTSLGAVTGILGGATLATTDRHATASLLGGAGAASGLAGRAAVKYLKNWDERIEDFNFQRSQKSYSEELRETEEVGVNYLRDFSEPDWLNSLELRKITNDYVEEGIRTEGHEAEKLYREIAENIETDRITQYVSFQEEMSQNRYDIQLYDQDKPLVGFTGYTEKDEEEFLRSGYEN